jgi:hypothetical protein
MQVIAFSVSSGLSRPARRLFLNSACALIWILGFDSILPGEWRSAFAFARSQSEVCQRPHCHYSKGLATSATILRLAWWQPMTSVAAHIPAKE